MAVQVTDIETALGRPLTDTEQAQAVQWIADARLILENRLGDLAALDQPTLDYVTREAVTARFRNPEGYQSETIDDYTYRHGSESRRVTILPEWWAMLSPTAERGAFSVSPSFVPDDSPAAWLDWS